MPVKQISVFIENRKGSLGEFCKLLGDAGVDLIALSLADTTDFGIVRAMVNDNDKVLKLVKEGGYTANLTDVVAVAVDDTPGGLAQALQVLTEGDISIEYLYSFVRRVEHHAVIIFRVGDVSAAEKLLAEKGVRTLNQNEVTAACC